MPRSEINSYSPFVLYLHGFASGPSSTKAKFFSERLAEHGIEMCIPDLNYPSFEKMTLSSQLDLVDRIIEKIENHERILIAGSSMGGLLAVLAARKWSSVVALVLMAPGFGLSRRIERFCSPDEFDAWRRTGATEFFHYKEQRKLPLSYEFVRDIDRHSIDDLIVDVPTAIFHGLRDETVPSEESINFRQSNSDKVELYLLDDDHQLLGSLDEIWKLSVNFMERQGIIGRPETINT